MITAHKFEVLRCWELFLRLQKQLNPWWDSKARKVRGIYAEGGTFAEGGIGEPRVVS